FTFSLPRPPRSTIFPYTTLFRSGLSRRPAGRGQRRTAPLERRTGVEREIASAGPWPSAGLLGAGRTGPQRPGVGEIGTGRGGSRDRKRKRLNSSDVLDSFAGFCL